MVYAVGDLHGYRTELDRVLALIDADGGTGAPVVFLGDYVDRGPDSRAVIDTLVRGVSDGRPWTCILGNHDRLLLLYLTSGLVNDGVLRPDLTWLNPRMGGQMTLASYLAVAPDQLPEGEALLTQARAAVPQVHLDFLTTAKLFHETEDQIFVHAGLRPGIPLARQAEDDLLWIRAPFLEDTRDHGRLVVHGHTALDTPCHYGNRLNLDSGAGYGRPATVAWLDGRDAWTLSDDGRQPLRP